MVIYAFYGADAAHPASQPASHLTVSRHQAYHRRYTITSFESKIMSPLTSRVNRVIKVASRDAASDDGKSCSNNAWSCLNTAGQFGVIFSIIIVVITIAWVYWYTVIRPRQERIRESGEDIELDLGDGRTVVVSSGPYRRTVVFRGARSPTPPPPAYRPPTPGAGVIVPPGFATTTDSLPPSPRASHTQIWPPQTPPQRPQTPQNVPPQSMSTPNFVQGYPFPGSYSQPIPLAMYPPQVMVPGPPPTPPAMMYPRAQPQTYLVIPPPPPRPPDMPAQGLIPPPPPPPPPPPSQPPNGGIYQQPTGTDSQVRTRPPSPGHASTIEDDDSDRGGSLPPASRQERSPSRDRSPPAGGSQFTRSRTPSPSERRRQHARRRPAPSPSRSPPRGRQRKRTQQKNQGRNPPPQQDDSKSDNSKSSDTSYKSSTSLDSDMRTDYDNLFVEHDGRKRVEEAKRLQKLVDRIDKEEEEEREHRSAYGEASGVDKLPRLPGQPLRPAVPRAETANAVAETSVEQQDPQRRQEGNEAYEIDNEESQTNHPKRHVTFQQPSLEVLESRIGRPSRRSQSPARIPNQEDLHHGESRVGRRRRTPSPDERIVERPVAPVLSSAESRIGRPQPPSPPKEHSLVHKRSHGCPGAGESRVGHHHGRKRRLTHPPETISPGAGSDYYNTHDATHGGHPTIDDGFLLSIARSEGPPSSAGATCGTRSHASSESNDRRRRMGLTPSRFNRDRDQRADEGATPYLRSPSPEE